jgi:aldehyde:ferredoxin oxidoreductase
VIFTGKAEFPVYLWVNYGTIEVRDAQSIWGKNTFESDELLRKETDLKARTCTIGQSGEKMLKLASIIFEGTSARAAGRTGLGAVMGAKNLKAIVVRGSKKIALAQKDKLNKSLKEVIPRTVKYRNSAKLYGTNNDMPGADYLGDAPIKNWQGSVWAEGAEKTTGAVACEKYLAEHYACYACALRCGKEYKMETGPYAGVVSKGPEYETAAGFGLNLLIDNMESIVHANIICNDYGVDTMSASGVIAVVMEAYDRSILEKKDLDGLEARWGNTDDMLNLLRKLVTGEGVGKILGNGPPAVAEWIGNFGEEIVIATKGLDPPLHDPRASFGSGLSFATSNRGACHLEGMTHSIEYGNDVLKDYGYEKVDRFTTEGKAKLTALGQNFMAVYNALGICKLAYVGRVGPDVVTDWTNYVMGWNLTEKDLIEIGERIYNVKRLFNNRLNITRKDDSLSLRILTLQRTEGTAAGQLPCLNRMLSEYYEVRGWDEFGIPTPEKVEQLGLGHLME